MQPTLIVIAAAALLGTAPSAGAQEASADRAAWGVLADMAGHDYYYLYRGTASSAVRIDWARPNQELRFVRLLGKNLNDDCRLAPSGGAEFTGHCRTSKGRESDIVATRDPDGSVEVSTLTKRDWSGQYKLKWGRFRRADDGSGYELRLSKSYRLAMRPLPADGVNVSAKWLPAALAALDPVAPSPGQLTTEQPVPLPAQPTDQPPI